ncbi:hypothetical protein [Enterococcus faecalis]|uniref:hypothetical protein n=1 Tax=Enterococcus TaxID=1350 RepID=UPI001D09C7BC|nr:hypothetical protein [Enterococcus faecalis]MCB8473022.1 hypothetical protein [Enterococcus faecalis]MCB8501125.1 hypothetical protein [Enterococcus faecalis]MCB8519459.1 hypothetical protein [Enterococcus faecalis]
MKKEIAKSEKEMKKIHELLPFLEFSYEESKKAYEKKKLRYENLKKFIVLAKEELVKRKQEDKK